VNQSSRIFLLTRPGFIEVDAAARIHSSIVTRLGFSFDFLLSHRATCNNDPTMKPKPKTNPEFERFKEFTKKLMAVPKKEIDRQKAVYENACFIDAARVQWYDESRAFKLSFKQQMSPAG
jgi:hypothetical protein